MARSVRSWKNLWALLSEKTILKSTDLIGNELQNNADGLLNGILHYKKSSSTSLTELKNCVSGSKLEFLSKFSKLIDVDALQCLQLFTSYVYYEYKGTEKNLQVLLGSERYEQFMLLEMWSYYYSERLYCLLTLKHILEHWHDSEDEQQSLYKDFMECMDSDRLVISNVLKEMELILSLEVPNKETHGPMVNDALISRWVTAVLKEQCELFEILVLCLKFMDPKLNEVQRIFAICQKHGFGLRLPFRQYISEENNYLAEKMRYLGMFVIVQSIYLDEFFNLSEGMLDVDHFLLKDETALKSLDSTVQSLGFHESHGPILLSWMVLGYCSNSDLILPNLSKFSNLAVQLDVFGYVSRILQKVESDLKGEVYTVLHSVAYNILLSAASCFEISTLGPLKPIFNILEAVLKVPSIAEDFWCKGTSNGVGVLLKYSIECFPLNFSTLIKLSTSLAQAGKSSSKQVLKCIRDLPVVSEYMETVNPMDIAATEENSVFQLVKRRMLYGDRNLVIAEGTMGVVATNSGQATIQWQTHVNGWQIILRELHTIFSEISASMGAVSDSSLSKITCVANLVHKLLQTDISCKEPLKHITSVLFSIFHRLSTHPSPPLDLMGKCLDIATLLFDENSTIWLSITQINFLPFISGFSRDINELASGMLMSMGTLGELIASKECVFGKYILCISFLNLVVTVSDNVPEDGSNNFVSCVVYILREIFSCFHKWCYLDPQEKITIGQACLNLFHNIFTIENHAKVKVYDMVRKICIFNMLNFESGQTLLRIVCTGEAVIQQTIMKQNCYYGEEIASLIRLSLSVLNRLLLLRNSNLELNQRSSLSETPFEKVLFSTPGNSEQPQVVLTVANYAFQYYNPRLATLAVQLLKRFAKEFPMSLLACFGTEAEAIRDHFLSRLSSPYDDIRLKVSILEFLTVCIAQQPGLIEMFININTKSDDGKAGGCLESVKQILKEKPERKDDYFQDLQCAAVEFVHAIWAGHQGLAMEALKKDSEFWKHLSNSLLSQNIDVMHPKIIAYIIRTMALELFYTSSNVGCVNSSGNGLKDIMQTICKDRLLEKWSNHINSISVKDGFSSSRLDILDRSLSEAGGEDFALYTAWRDFLLVLAKWEVSNGLKILPQTKVMIMNHILTNLLNQITTENSRLMILLSESYVMMFSHWKSDCTGNSNENFQLVEKLVSDLATHCDLVHPRVQLAVVIIAMYTIKSNSQFKNKNAQYSEWVAPVCKILKKCSALVDRALMANDASILKLPIAVISLLSKLIAESNNWLSVLKSHVILPLLVSFLMKSLRSEAGLKLSLFVITVFVSVAASNKAAEVLCNTGFMNDVTLIFSTLQSDFQTPEAAPVLGVSKKITLATVYYAFLRLLRALLQSLGNYFLQDALNFVGVHLENIHSTFSKVKLALISSNLQDVTLTCAFLYQLSLHRQSWYLGHPKSLEVLLNDICFCINSVIALLMRPTLLKHMVQQANHPSKKVSILPEKSGITLCLSGQDDGLSERVVHVQTELLKLLATCLSTLQKFSPGLYETMSDHRIDHGQWQLFLELAFQTPSVDQEAPASFGAILACVSICLRWLTENDRTPSPGRSSDTSVQIERHLLIYVLEMSLTLLLSQCSLALTHPDIHKSYKQLIRRELASELNVLMQTMNRYFRRGPLSPASSSNQAATHRVHSQSSEFPFMKLINYLVSRLVK